MSGVKERKAEVKAIDPYGKSVAGRLARWVDDALFFISPKWGAGRKSVRYRDALMQQRADKLGVSWTRPNTNRDSNWLASGYSIDLVMWNDLAKLQERCAEMYRTNDIAHAAIEGRVANEIGCGIKPQARVTNDSGEQVEDVNLALEKSFLRWSKYGVDETRTMSFFEFERLVDRSLGIFGEAIVLISDTPSQSGITTTLELISPERLSPPPGMETDHYNRLGVQLNKNGTIAGYWIRSQHPQELTNQYEYKWNYYPRFDSRGMPRVIHIYENNFAGQHRGIPWMAAALDRMKDLDDWWEAELIAKQVEACFGLIFTGGPQSASPYDQAVANSSGSDGHGRQLEELQPGLIHYASEDESVTTIDPQRPGATFAPFVELTLRSIASSLNYPYEILAKNFFRTTFSSGQLAMLDGRHGFKTRRQLIIEKFLVPVWNRIVDDAVFYDEVGGTIDITQYVSSPEPFTQSVWVAPGWGFINPRDEVRAATDALDADITTLSTLYAERGEDAETQLRKRQEEKLREVEATVERRKYQWELEEQYGLPHTEQPQTEESSNVDNDTASQEEEEESEYEAAS